MSQLFKQLTPKEQAEVEVFTTFLIAKRTFSFLKVEEDEISSDELMKLTSESGSFDWLNSPEEDKYSLEDGEDVIWPE